MIISDSDSDSSSSDRSPLPVLGGDGHAAIEKKEDQDWRLRLAAVSGSSHYNIYCRQPRSKGWIRLDWHSRKQQKRGAHVDVGRDFQDAGISLHIGGWHLFRCHLLHSDCYQTLSCLSLRARHHSVAIAGHQCAPNSVALQVDSREPETIHYRHSDKTGSSS